jgi:uncharacterized iron-regulated membrane protein
VRWQLVRRRPIARTVYHLAPQDRAPGARRRRRRSRPVLLGIKRGLGGANANGLHEWIVSLHIGSVGGVWYRALVSIVGLAVAALSVTGVVLWMRKREARIKRSAMTRLG